MQNILRCFLLVILLTNSVKTELGNVTAPEKFSSGFQNNLGGTSDETTVTTSITVSNKGPGDVEARNGTAEKNEYEKKHYNESHQMIQRKSRFALKTMTAITIECLKCYGAGTLSSDEACYKGEYSRSKLVNCADAETCFTELHPLYIKRGCMLASGLNRTFVCKCPLCNDKPSEDATYYEYKTVSDWQYDNERLKKPVVNLDLFCKTCQTAGRNETLDITCRDGSRADYMLCGHKQLCYTNIDLQADFVSRGCIDPPVYNTMITFCNFSYCNTDYIENPAKTRRELVMRALTYVEAFTSGTAVAHQTFLSPFTLIYLRIVTADFFVNLYFTTP